MYNGILLDVNLFIQKQYPNPPCWALVSDIYTSVLGLKLRHLKPKNPSLRAISERFRLALHTGEHGLERVLHPVDFCIVCFAKKKNNTPHHCGVYYKGQIIHATEQGNLFQDLHSLTDTYERIEYWQHKKED
jgi:cell wall-associated NlpC family hydrolase